MIKRIPFYALMAIAVFYSPAYAQIKAEHPRNCIFNVGPTQMMFSAFQERQTDEIFCQHVPKLGLTMIILDARQPELTDMNIDVRVLRDVGQKDWRDDLDANTVSLLPQSKYLKKRNTLSFNYEFSDEGNYITVVRAKSDDELKEYIGEYSFSVGETYQWLQTLCVLLIAVGAVSFGIWHNKSNKPHNNKLMTKRGDNIATTDSDMQECTEIQKNENSHRINADDEFDMPDEENK